MQYRRLGNCEQDVSILGMGCMRLPIIDEDEGRIDEVRATALLHQAIDAGINYLDTAYPYHQGQSEVFLGKALRRNGLRDRVLLASKLPCWAIESSADFDRYLNEQLTRLQTDHIDCYLLHALKQDWWTRLYELGVLDFLERAKADGRIGCAGFSFHDELPVFKTIVDRYDWGFCMIQYNYMDQEIQAGRAGMEYAAARGLGVMVMEPLRGGHLAHPASEELQALWEQAEVRRSPAEWALRWVWNHPQVSGLLSGMNSPEQITENVRIAASVRPGAMSAAELALVDRVRELLRRRIKIPCTCCNYCLPCPAGVNIPKIFSLYNDGFIYGDHRFPQRLYSIAMNASARADQCTGCGRCEELCPQRIAIIDGLAESHRLLSESAEDR